MFKSSVKMLDWNSNISSINFWLCAFCTKRRHQFQNKLLSIGHCPLSPDQPRPGYLDTYFVFPFDINASIWRGGGQMLSGRWRRRYEAVINSTPPLFWPLFTPLTLFLSTTNPPLVMVTYKSNSRSHQPTL